MGKWKVLEEEKEGPEKEGLEEEVVAVEVAEEVKQGASTAVVKDIWQETVSKNVRSPAEELLKVIDLPKLATTVTRLATFPEIAPKSNKKAKNPPQDLKENVTIATNLVIWLKNVLLTTLKTNLAGLRRNATVVEILVTLQEIAKTLKRSKL